MQTIHLDSSSDLAPIPVPLRPHSRHPQLCLLYVSFCEKWVSLLTFLSRDNWRVRHKSQLYWLSVTWMGIGFHRVPGFAPSWHPLLMSLLPWSLHEPVGCSAAAFQGVCLEQGSRPRSVNFTGSWPQKFPFQSTSIPKIERGKEITQGTDKPLFQGHGLSNYIKSCFLWRELPWWWFFFCQFSL